MDVENTPLAGVLLFTPRIFRDSRGYFLETWRSDFYEAAGVSGTFVQDNHSQSRQAVLRGIHFQHERPQGKLVSVSYGRVFDVAVDLRRDSPSFGRWHGVELSAENQRQLWLPPGMGHAFCVLSDTAHVHYKCTEYYLPGDEGAIVWNDPDLAVAWPLSRPVLSAKDAAAPGLRQWMNSRHD
jgi:dTDP-4-dehydrorhamnose 3,5-epimerase